MKPILVSGIKPEGHLHLGNFLGSLKNFVDLQNSGDYDCYFFIADLHSLTEDFDQKKKTQQILELTAEYLSAGIDPVKDSDESHGASPKKSTIFLQSSIPAHSELMWLLTIITPEGELRRMTQYKDKVIVKKQNSNSGLLMYPVLMASDILLYDAEFVPVGEDQVQHLELTRTLARKFNARFGKTFVEPQPILTKTPRVMSLTDPRKKMSKSEPNGCLFIDDSPKEIESKIKRAVTDSGSEIKYDLKHKAGVSNLLDIYSSLSGKSISKLEKEFSNKKYSEFKIKLIELVSDYFADFRKKKKALMKTPDVLKKVLRHGSGQAAVKANKKILEVKKKIGLTL